MVVMKRSRLGRPFDRRSFLGRSSIYLLIWVEYLLYEVGGLRVDTSVYEFDLRMG